MKVYILKDSWDKIINYAKAAYHGEKAEIGGMSVVTQDKDGDWWIEDPQIMNQEIGATTCDLDKEDLAKYYTQMAVKYKDTNFRFCWWHSHHTMGAFWSGTDLSSIDEYGEGESDLSFALVVNLKEEYKCRISVWKPLQVHQDVELEIVGKEDVEIPLEIVTEVKAKCRTRSLSSYQTGYTRLPSQGRQLSLGNYGFDTRGMSSSYKLLEDDCMGIRPTEQEATNLILGQAGFKVLKSAGHTGAGANTFVAFLITGSNADDQCTIAATTSIGDELEACNFTTGTLVYGPFTQITMSSPTDADVHVICYYG